MNNGDVCEFIEKLNDEKEYIADICVNDEYGQTCGGYLSSKDADPKSIKQKEHFMNYYGRNDELKNKKPTYQYLRCPQLLLFIAELAEMPDVEEAYEMLKVYEEKNSLYKTDKSGNYLWGTKDGFLSEFKQKLGIYQLVKIIKSEDVSNWDDVKERVKISFD